MAEEEEAQSLSRDQLLTLQRAGLTKDQVNRVDLNISKLKIESSSKVELIVERLQKDVRFRDDFFEDPSSAINKISLHSTK